MRIADKRMRIADKRMRIVLTIAVCRDSVISEVL